MNLGEKICEGLHIGLDEDRYHADPALGSGDIRRLSVNPIYYWQDSLMNPLRRERAETPALLVGRAMHKLVLEGPEAFAKAYPLMPTPEDYPEALVTATDIKARLKELGEKQSGDKAELVERLSIADPTAVIFDTVLAEFKARTDRPGITPINRATHAEAVAAASVIARNPRVRPVFQSGQSEVSVFWDIGGVPMKARLDKLRLGKRDGRPLGIIADLKSYANIYKKAPERAIMDSIAQTRLDIQAAAYLQGALMIPEFIKAGKVYGSGYDAAWLEGLAAIEPEDWEFWWCFYEKGAPITMLRAVRSTSPIIEAAKMDVARAIEGYRENIEAFGTEWSFVDPIPDPMIEQSDLPKWMLLGA